MVTIKNVFVMYEFAQCFNAQQLTSFCIYTMGINWNKIEKKKEFLILLEDDNFKENVTRYKYTPDNKCIIQ